MLKFSCLITVIALSFAPPALAAKKPPAKAARLEAPLPQAETDETMAELNKLLEESRKIRHAKADAPSQDEFQEELQMNATGKKANELEELPEAPNQGATSRQ